MKIYVIARSENNAMQLFLDKKFYFDKDDAVEDFSEFGKPWEQVFEIEIPLSMKVIADVWTTK